MPAIKRDENGHQVAGMGTAMEPPRLPIIVWQVQTLLREALRASSSSWLRQSARVSTTGLVIAHYERTGDIKIGDTALDSPSDAERARQERMKREG